MGLQTLALTLMERVRGFRSEKVSNRPIDAVAFCPVDCGRQLDLSLAFKSMDQLERMGFLIRLATLWHDAGDEARQELLECLGGLVEPFLGKKLEVATGGSEDAYFLRLWVHREGSVDVQDSGRRFLLLIRARDPQLIEELAAAVDLF